MLDGFAPDFIASLFCYENRSPGHAGHGAPARGPAPGGSRDGMTATLAARFNVFPERSLSWP